MCIRDSTVWPHASVLGYSTGCRHQRFAQAILLLPFHVYSVLRISSSEWYSSLHRDVWNHICTYSTLLFNQDSHITRSSQERYYLSDLEYSLRSSSIHGQHVFLSFDFDHGIYSYSAHVHILSAILDVSFNSCLQKICAGPEGPRSNV